MFKVPEQYRVRGGDFATSLETDGNNGAFFVPNHVKGSHAPLKVMASDGGGWDHVSVSLPHRCPTWEEMCRVVSLFWDDEDAVVQLHPPRSQWVNNHPYCLHLWRPQECDVVLPPSWMVGYQDLGDVRDPTSQAHAQARRRYFGPTP